MSKQGFAPAPAKKETIMQTTTKKERMISTSAQFTLSQFDILNRIIDEREDRPSNAVILREAFDFYVDNKYAHLRG